MKKKLPLLLGLILGMLIISPVITFAQQANVDFNSFFTPERFSRSVTLLLSVGAIGFIPFIFMSTTCFIRVVIVLGMVRGAIGTQQAPPNPVVVSLALFISMFIMTPVFTKINTEVIKPYQAGEMTQIQALQQGTVPVKEFMLKFTRDKDLALFLEFSKVRAPEDYIDIPIYVLIPAFLISELKTAFQIGFLLYIPFVIIDLIVSNILLSLGMFMLSPAMISTPFKILLFVLTDGWNLIIQGLLVSYT